MVGIIIGLSVIFWLASDIFSRLIPHTVLSSAVGTLNIYLFFIQMDLYHRFEDQGPKFERLLIDIEHLDLC